MASFIWLSTLCCPRRTGVTFAQSSTKVTKSALFLWGPKEQKITAIVFIFVFTLYLFCSPLRWGSADTYRWFLDFCSQLLGCSFPHISIKNYSQSNWPLLYYFHIVCSRLRHFVFSTLYQLLFRQSIVAGCGILVGCYGAGLVKCIVQIATKKGE